MCIVLSSLESFDLWVVEGGLKGMKMICVEGVRGDQFVEVYEGVWTEI